MTVKAEQLNTIFAFHPATPEQTDAYLEIRARAQDLADAILRNTPVCGDQQAAIRKVREAVMTANAAVALGGLV